MNELYLEEVRSKVPFNDAIQHYLRVVSPSRVSKFKVYKAYCPFCEEPKMRVNPVKRIMFCDDCGFGGDILSIIARSENETIRDAAQRLVDKYDIEVEQSSNECRGASRAG